MYVGKPEPLVLSWLDNLWPLIWSRWNSLSCRPVPWWRFNECEWDGSAGAKTEGPWFASFIRYSCNCVRMFA